MHKRSTVIPKSWCYGGIAVGMVSVAMLLGSMVFESDDIRPQAKVSDDQSSTAEVADTQVTDNNYVRARTVDTNSAAMKTPIRR